MTTFRKFEVRIGGLTDEDREAIFELAGRGVKAWTIARRLRRHPSTVAYFMYRHGLKKLAAVRRKPYARGGKLVQAYSAKEDDFIQDLAIAGLRSNVIADRLLQVFGIERSRDGITERLMLLASNETAREDELEPT